MNPTTQDLVSIIVAAIGLTSAYIVTRIGAAQAKDSRQIADLRADIVVLKAERDEAETRERLLSDYVHKLRDHIATGKGSPPPSWPDGLVS